MSGRLCGSVVYVCAPEHKHRPKLGHLAVKLNAHEGTATQLAGEMRAPTRPDISMSARLSVCVGALSRKWPLQVQVQACEHNVGAAMFVSSRPS